MNAQEAREFEGTTLTYNATLPVMDGSLKKGRRRGEGRIISGKLETLCFLIFLFRFFYFKFLFLLKNNFYMNFLYKFFI
jgi:hypothetical protein